MQHRVVHRAEVESVPSAAAPCADDEEFRARGCFDQCLVSRSLAHHPEVQHLVADMRISYDAAEAFLERTCADWTAGVEHPDWPVRLIGCRSFVIDKAYEIVDKALDLTGGAGAFRRNRLEQLVRRWPLVRECHALSGDADYLLTCVAPDLETAQQFVIAELTAAPNVQSVRTMLTLKTVKSEPRVPLGEH